MGFFNTPPQRRMRAAHLMIDIETGGVKPGAAVLAIGAIIFDPYTLDDHEALKEHSFYRNICAASSENVGLRFEAATLEWWRQQDPAVREALAIDPIPLHQAAKEFCLWLSNQEYRIGAYWANAPSFDRILWQHALEAVGKQWPLPFWIERDVRTLKALAWPNGDPPNENAGLRHNALDDAAAQAQWVQWGYRALGLSDNPLNEKRNYTFAENKTS